MRNPEKTGFNKEYWSERTFTEFSKWWKNWDLDGDPKDYWKKASGKTLKKKKNNESIES